MLTIIHTAISIAAMLLGVAVVKGLFDGEPRRTTTTVYFVTSVLTTATGFLFPLFPLKPPQYVGFVSVVVLVVALLTRRSSADPQSGGWVTYRITTVISIYLLFFVAVAQAFDKIPALHALAPTGKEPPFGVAQGILFLVFAAVAYGAIRRGRRVTSF